VQTNWRVKGRITAGSKGIRSKESGKGWGDNDDSDDPDHGGTTRGLLTSIGDGQG